MRKQQLFGLALLGLIGLTSGLLPANAGVTPASSQQEQLAQRPCCGSTLRSEDLKGSGTQADPYVIPTTTTDGKLDIYIRYFLEQGKIKYRVQIVGQKEGDEQTLDLIQGEDPATTVIKAVEMKNPTR